MNSKTSAFLIDSFDQVVATIETDLRGGASVSYGYESVTDQLNANHPRYLVSARTGKVSRAKKWERLAVDVPAAEEINDGDFLLTSDDYEY